MDIPPGLESRSLYRLGQTRRLKLGETVRASGWQASERSAKFRRRTVGPHRVIVRKARRTKRMPSSRVAQRSK